MANNFTEKELQIILSKNKNLKISSETKNNQKVSLDNIIDKKANKIKKIKLNEIGSDIKNVDCLESILFIGWHKFVYIGQIFIISFSNSSRSTAALLRILVR